MKAYLITTGSIFGLLTVLHIWRVIAEHMSWTSNRPEFLSMMVLSGFTAVLSIWAFRLLRRASR